MVIENEHVNGAVQEVIHMNGLAGLGAEDAVVFIHDIEEFCAVLGGGGGGEAGEGFPLGGGEILGARVGADADVCGEQIPTGTEFRQEVVELFAAGGKSASDKRLEGVLVEGLEFVAGLAAHGDDRRVDLRPRVEDGGRKFACEADVPAAPDTDGHRAVILRSAGGSEALGEFELERENED